MAPGSEEGAGDAPRIAVTTVTTTSEAGQMARALVELGLAACVTVFPNVLSTYRWEGRIETASEQILWIKTTERCLPDLERELLALHPYEVPEFLVLNVNHASPAYLSWLVAATHLDSRGTSPRTNERAT